MRDVEAHRNGDGSHRPQGAVWRNSYPCWAANPSRDASRPRPHPLRVLTSLAQQTGQRPRDNVVTRTCEVVCEIKLDCGGRIVQRGQLTDVKAFDFGVEDAYTCVKLNITGANHDVVMSKTGINYYELSEGWMFNQAIRPEDAHFLAARPDEEWTEEAQAAD